MKVIKDAIWIQSHRSLYVYIGVECPLCLVPTDFENHMYNESITRTNG